MKRYLSKLNLLMLPLAIASASIIPAKAATTTAPVGVVKITIAKAVSANQPTFSFLSTSMSAGMAYQGTISAGATGTISIADDDWTINQFTSTPHYALIASGPREGELLDIASNTVNTLTLSGGPGSDDQSDLVGETLRIHKHNTLASIFGNDHTTATTTVKVGNRATADHILLYNSQTATYETYYFNTEVNPLPVGGIFHQGWVNSAQLSVDASQTPIYPDDGFIYKRVATTDFSLSVNGLVIDNRIDVPLIEGYNLVAIPYPVDKSISLESSGLRPTGDDTFDIKKHLVEGSQDTADLVSIYDSSTGQYSSYYYNNVTNPLPVGGDFHQGWVNSSANLSTDASSTLIPAGGAVFIYRRAGRPALTWSFNNILE